MVSKYEFTPRSAVIRASRVKSGEILFEAIWGQKPIVHLRETQRDEVIDEVLLNQNRLPEVVDVRLNGRQINDYRGDKANLMGKMRLGTRALMLDSTEGEALVDIELLPIIKDIMAKLRSASQKMNKSGRSTGRHASSYRYVVGGALSRVPPTREEDFTFIGIANVAPYAATLEVPTWHRPMRRVFLDYVKKRALKEGFDARLRYIQGVSDTYLKKGIVPDPLRDFYTRGKVKGTINPRALRPRLVTPATPMIEIAPLGAFTDTRTGPIQKNRNCRRMSGRKPQRCLKNRRFI